MSEINMNMNDWADFWRSVGFNVIPMNGKIPVEGYKQFFGKAIPIELHNYWKKLDLFNNGIAIINGRLWNHEYRKHLFGHTIDCDSEAGTKLVCNVNGVQHTPEEMTKKGLAAEYHKGTPSKYHFIVFSEQEFPNLPANISGVEVKGSGGLTTVTASIHEDGTNRELLGDSLKALENCIIHTEFIYHINDKLNSLGINYLDGKANGNGNYNPVLRNKAPIHKGERHTKLLSYANSLIARLYKTTNRETIYNYLVVYNNDPNEVEEPLHELELKKIFNDSWDNITTNSTTEDRKKLKDVSDGNGEDSEKKRQTKIRVAFETVRQHIQNLFIDEYQTPHIALPIQDHLEVLPVDSNVFKNWYKMFIFERDGIVLDSTTINDLCGLASAYAASAKYGTQINLNLRTALKSDFKTEWIYDLVNKNWEFIRITSSGWDIFRNEIIFRRYNNQKAQVYPDRNYEADIFDQFMGLVNIKDKESILLLKCYIISLFIPEIQKVVLILRGSQGAAKSSLQEFIRTLVDPSIAKTLVFPRQLNELIQQLSHNYITYYDNISSIPPWISDQLCRAVSGSASSKRQLYTDDDDKIYNFKRCVGMNGINLVATKEDLLDRSIIIGLDDIEDENRRIPQELWKEFDNIRPKLLGYIFDILAKVLEYEENNSEVIKKLKLTRMTEFAKHGEIISRCIGNKENEFINAYKRNREIQVDEIVESSQVATAIMCMMFRKYEDLKVWDGTPTALYTELREVAQNDVWELNIDTNDRYWPKNVKSLGKRLNEIKPTLKAKGLKITHYKESDVHRTRKVEIRKVLSNMSNTSESEKSRSNFDNFSDKTLDKTENLLSEDIGKNRAQNQGPDVSDVSDNTLHTFTGDAAN